MIFGALVVATMLLASHPFRPPAIELTWQDFADAMPCADGGPELCPAIYTSAE